METNLNTFGNVDDHFSPNLLALMGEWVTYRAFDSKQGLADDYPLREMFGKSLLCDDTDIFGVMGKYGPANDEKFFWVSSTLLNYGIVKNDVRALKSIVFYDDIRATFLKNIDVGTESIFVTFANTLCYRPALNNSVNMTTPRIETFTIDLGCEPLVQALRAEGYIRSQGATYFWTEKIRPLFEYCRVWGQPIFISNEEKFIQSLSPDYLKSLDKCWLKQGFSAALTLLKQHPDTQNSHFISEAHKAAPHEILRILYPETSSQTEDIPQMMWFGETTS